MNGLALCAGVGGLELGLKLALTKYRCVCYVEREAYPAAILVTRMAEGILDEAPIWDDLATFDGRPWRGVVDLISAGFPCQPWSTAGERRGTEDDRWLWPDIQRIVRGVGPRYVFLENVPGILFGGLHLVLADLAAMGYDAVWGVFSAAGVGAPHRRERVFILAHASAYPDENELREAHGASEGFQNRPEVDARQPDRSGRWGGAGPMADPHCRGQQEEQSDLRRRQQDTDRGRGRPGMLANPDRQGLDGAGTDRGRPTLARLGAPCEIPPDTRSGGLEGVWAELEPQVPGGAWPEQGCWWEAEPQLGRVADGVAHRVDRLRATGNGVVPLVAAVAFRELSRRFR